MRMSIENQMLEALELLHYSHRFRANRFVFVLGPTARIEDIQLDLRLLEESRISSILFCVERPDLEETVQRYSDRGSCFEFLSPARTKNVKSAILDAVSSGSIPVVPFPAASDTLSFLRENNLLELISDLGADKAFLLTEHQGLLVDGRLQSHPSDEELERFLSGSHELNIDREFLRYLATQREARALEIVLLGSETGSIFQEIFTHHGKGTLLSGSFPNAIRRATLADTHDIALLLGPSIRDSSVLPQSEDQISADIENYFVYTVDKELVASAKLTDFGEAMELAKFATLPRYQGRGRARELARYMMNVAADAGKAYVFALSTNPKMWEFFLRLGFREVERESLPQQWQEHYDFSRPSKAFHCGCSA